MPPPEPTDAPRTGLGGLATRLLEPDRYGLLAILIIVSVLATSLVAIEPWGGIVLVLLFGAVLLFALHTSCAPQSVMVAAGAVVALGLALSVAAVLGHAGSPLVEAARAAACLLLPVVPFVIGRRLIGRQEIDGGTVFGALSIYLVVGLFFASLYGLVGFVEPGGFFASHSPPDSVDYIYFSYVTLTTVGYGDLVAAGDLGRMLAVTEALTGQLYLVTVVALVVSRVRPRGGRD